MTAKPKLLDQLRTEVRVRHFSIRTEEAYTRWVRRYVLFHGTRHPRELGTAEVSTFLSYLAEEEQVAASTQNQALSALLFLYRHVLKQEMPSLENVVRARRPTRLPTVFTQAEVAAVLGEMQGTARLAAALLYGSGLRLLECLRLRVKDIGFEENAITVRDGKGQKDRVTMLPLQLKGQLRDLLAGVRRLHRGDLQAGFGSVYLPNALERKYPGAARSWGWQYVFPAMRRSTDPRSGEIRRHHLGEKALQRAVAAAVKRAGVTKHGSCHTFRHSFATHLLEAGYFRSHRAGAARAHGRAHHHNLHPRAQPGRPGCAEPAGPEVMRGG